MTGDVYDRAVDAVYRKQQNNRATAYVSWYLRSGSVEIESEHSSRRAHQGDWVFIDAFITRSHHFSKDAAIVSIRHRVNWRGLQFIPPGRPPIVYNGALSHDLLKAAEALISFSNKYTEPPQQESDSLSSLRMVRLHTWLYYWHRIREQSNTPQATVKDTRVYTIMSQIGNRRSIRPIPYKDIITNIGLSKAQIDRIFKAELGITPKQWQEAQCLQAAEELLASGTYTSKEIAAELDFSDASHFSKWFSQQSGLAPRKWKQQYMNDT
jgi:AraC-like DNA-binding protein